ncbi:hypothetical protein OGY87_21220 [Citrobacter sp. Cy234]|nr:hypothetical protein [Citrobacter sp. Cy234]MDM2728316.1 hypothetical protein [Citrobacter sp. Cy234]
MFAGKKSAQIREILISESAWEEMTCLFAPSLEDDGYMEGVLKSIIENGKKDFNEFLKKHKYKASIKNVYFDEVLVNLRQIHQVMSHYILHI